MYEEFFGFSGSPFRLAPDPKFFFGSKSHNKAMAYLHYGLRQAEGFIVITGEIGAGKSILIAHLIDQLDRSNVMAANLITPNLAPEDLLSHILSAFRIEAAGEGKAAEIEAFEDFLFDQMNRGRRVLLIVDEAQNLPVKTLEELRVLSNLEYDGTPLFQVFLVGQPDFREVMARADMEQLRQRVIATYHLEPMSRADTEKYVLHRLSYVGRTDDPFFTSDAFDAIYAATDGVPRKIHKLCNRVLLYCAVEKAHQIDGATVALVLADMSAEQLASKPKKGAAARDLDAEAAFAAVKATIAEPVLAPGSEPVAEPDTVESPEAEAEIEALAEIATLVEDAPAAQTPDRVSEPAPISPLAPSTGSVFDRLRAKGRAASAPDEAEETHPPHPATLDDVANAIAAANLMKPREDASRAGSEADAASPQTAPDAEIASADAEPPPMLETPESWRQSVVMSINETREELKRAHQSVAKLRKQLIDIDKRREKRRNKIAASLERAESLLSSFQNTWR